MPIAIDLKGMSERIAPALDRAAHHAPNVADIVHTLIGCVAHYADPTSIQARGDGTTLVGNSVWFRSKASGKDYVLIYNHHTRSMEIRDRNLRGRALHSFTNSTSNPAIATSFAGL